MSQKPTKVPGIPKVPNDVSPLTRNFLNSLVEALEIRLGRRGDPKDRAITLRELVASGLAKELRSTPFDPNNITSSSIGVAPSNAEIDTTVPPVPSGLVAAGAYSVINLTWALQYGTYPNHGFTEVWSASVDNRAEAVFTGTSAGNTYMDAVGSGESRYYWIRNVSQSGIAGHYNSSAGTFAETSADVEYLLEQLASSITSSELHADLSTPIGNLPDDTTQAIADLKTETDKLIDAVNLDIDGVNDDIDDINESITDLTAAVSAEIDADILALNTTIDEDIASLKSETEGLIDEAKAEINAIRNTPDWAAESDYLIGDLVKHDGKLYAAKVDHTSTADDGPADSEDNWTLVGEYGSLIDVLLQTESTRATLSTDYYTKTDADSAISTATTGLAAETKFADYTTTADLETNYYTKTDADSAISTATTGLAAETKFADYTTTADLETNYYTKTDADSAISTATTGLAAETKFADYTTTADLETNYYTKTDADSAISTATTGLAAETKFADYTTTADLETNYYTKTDADSAISTATTGLAAETKFADYTTTADLETNYYTKTDADSAISTATTGLAAETKFADYTTTADLETNYYTKTDADSAISTATTGLAAETKFADYTTTADLETNYYTKTDADSAISTATTGLAAETKFADYTTTADLETNYYTKTDADSAISTATTGLAAETKFADYTTTADLETNYYTKTDADSAISTATTGLAAETKFADYTTTADLETNYYTKTDADSAISTATTGLAAETKFADYTTTADLETNYYTKTDADSAISTATTGLAAETKFADYTTTADLETNYYTKTDADSAISTATTGLAAESKFDDYTTSADLASNYYTKTDADSSIASATMVLKSETAGGFKAKETWSFGGSNATLHGWATAEITKSGGHNYLRLDSTDTDPRFYSPEISFWGGTNTIVQVKIRRVSGSGWHGTLYYDTNDHGETENFKKTISDPTVTNEWVIAEWDMSSLTTGGSDWVDHHISQLRFDFGNTASDTFDIEWIAVGRNAPPKGKGLPGNRFIHDPFEEWILGDQDIISDSSAPDGTGKVLRIEAGSFPTQADLIPIVKGAIYRVKFWARPTSSNPGRLYFSLRQFKDNKGNVGPVNSGRSPYKPNNIYRSTHNNNYDGTDQWGFYEYTWTEDDWQTGVKYIQPQFLDAYHSKKADGTMEPTPTGNWRISGFQIEEVTDLENTKAQIEVQAETINGLSAKYTVKTDVNGHIAGFGLASTANDSGNITSEFIVNADRFAIARGGSDTSTPSVPFTVQATATDGVPAGVYMNSAFIKNASITAAQIGSVNADSITSGTLDVTNRITAGSINASLLNLDGVTLKNDNGALKVDKITANAITSGTLDASKITVNNLTALDIEGDVNRIIPFSATNDVVITQNATTIWEGVMPASQFARRPFVIVTGWGLWQNDVTYKTYLQMKSDIFHDNDYTIAWVSTNTTYMYTYEWKTVTVKIAGGNYTETLPQGSDVAKYVAVSAAVLYTWHDADTNETFINLSIDPAFHDEPDSYWNGVFNFSANQTNWVTVGEIFARANFDYHGEPFALSGGLAATTNKTVDIRLVTDTWKSRGEYEPNVNHYTNYDHDKIMRIDGVMMELR